MIRFISSSFVVSAFLTVLFSSTIGLEPVLLFVTFLFFPPIEFKSDQKIMYQNYIHSFLDFINRIIQIYFQMKNKKQQQSVPKGILLSRENQTKNYSTINNFKNISGHTKVSTDWTINSHHLVPPHLDKKNKIKRQNKPIKENSIQISKPLPTSKSTKKLKIVDFPYKKQPKQIVQNQKGIQQYCLFQQSFIPITNCAQKKIVDEYLSKTADSTYDWKYFQKLSKPELKSRTNRRQSNQSNVPYQFIDSYKKNQFFEQNDQATSCRNLIEEGRTEIEVHAIAESQQIGIQYSERKTEHIQVQQNQESLSDLLLKLEFKHLGDQKSFKDLSKEQKNHFSQMLETIISKLNSPRKDKSIMMPISFERQIQDCLPQQDLQVFKQKQSIQLNYQRLQGLIFMRQYCQLNYIDQSQSKTKVSTSLIAIVNLLCHFFCYIQIEYSKEFLYKISKMYGLTYREKYRRATRNIWNDLDAKKYGVISYEVFENFLNLQNPAQFDNNDLYHIKAVFDALNEMLQQYRPFYNSNGQQFPWSLRLFVSLSEYFLDEESLQIIFRQIKQKFVQMISMLCGLMVEYKEPLLKNNPLELRRKQKQNIMIIQWLKQSDFNKDDFQLYQASTLHEISEQIYRELIEELQKQLNFFYDLNKHFLVSQNNFSQNYNLV